MNLKRLYKVEDFSSDVFHLVDEGISVDSIIKELNSYAPLEEKKKFLEHCDNAFDLAENLSGGDLVDYCESQLAGNSALLLSEANAYFTSDWIKAFVESVVKDNDLEEVEDAAVTPVSKLLKLLVDAE